MAGQFDATREDTVGVDGGTMKVAVGNLEDMKSEFTGWNNQLIDVRDQVINDWLGGAADQFTASYQQLADAMYNMIHYAECLRDHSQDSIDAYSVADAATQENVARVLSLNGMGMPS